MSILERAPWENDTMFAIRQSLENASPEFVAGANFVLEALKGKLPSRHQLDALVTADLNEAGKFDGRVCKVSFTPASVFYDIEVPVKVKKKNNKVKACTRVHSLESSFIVDRS